MSDSDCLICVCVCEHMRAYVCVCVQTGFQHCTKGWPHASVFVVDGLKGTGAIFGFGVCGLCLRSLLFCKNININHLEIKSYNM